MRLFGKPPPAQALVAHHAPQPRFEGVRLICHGRHSTAARRQVKILLRCVVYVPHFAHFAHAVTTLLADKSTRLSREPVALDPLRVEMRRRALTQTALSETSGIHRTRISKILAGRVIDPIALERIEAAIEAAPVVADDLTREEFFA